MSETEPVQDTASGEKQVSVSRSLIPIEQKRIDFYGDEITAVLVYIEDRQEIYVPIRPICTFLGIDWSAQRQRILRDPVLSEEIVPVVIITTGTGQQVESLCLPLDYLNGWLFGINANRIKSHLREGIIKYQKECYRVLAKHFRESVAIKQAPGYATLTQVRNMSLAIASLAQEQIEFEGKVTGQFEKVEVRLEAIEEQVFLGEYVTEAQASQISQSVKSVAMKLGEQSGRNEYGGVYGELYRKFGITSYKHLQANRYQEAMDWLTDWYTTLVGDEAF